MNKDTFEAALRELERQAALRENQGSYASKRCDNCIECMFCEGCQDCYACNYALNSQRCSRLNHAQGCQDSHQGSHLIDCQGCFESSYLIKCRSCIGCSYCFGCVGLVRKEFHILNTPYPRDLYFKKLKLLKKALSLS